MIHTETTTNADFINSDFDKSDSKTSDKNYNENTGPLSLTTILLITANVIAFVLVLFVLSLLIYWRIRRNRTYGSYSVTLENRRRTESKTYSVDFKSIQVIIIQWHYCSSVVTIRAM